MRSLFKRCNFPTDSLRWLKLFREFFSRILHVCIFAGFVLNVISRDPHAWSLNTSLYQFSHTSTLYIILRGIWKETKLNRLSLNLPAPLLPPPPSPPSPSIPPQKVLVLHTVFSCPSFYYKIVHLFICSRCSRRVYHLLRLWN